MICVSKRWRKVRYKVFRIVIVFPSSFPQHDNNLGNRAAGTCGKSHELHLDLEMREGSKSDRERERAREREREIPLNL